jgi:hypothetical protein
MPGLALGRRWVLIALAVAIVAVPVVVAFFSARPYLEYPDSTERRAVGHLDKATVDGFEYVGEDVSDVDAVSRFWIRKVGGVDLASAIDHDGRQLRRDHPGRDAPSRSRFEEAVGWLSLPGEDHSCALTAYRVIRVRRCGGPGPVRRGEEGDRSRNGDPRARRRRVQEG